MLYIQANHESIDGQYIAYCAYLFCKVVYDGFFRFKLHVYQDFWYQFYMLCKKRQPLGVMCIHGNIKKLYHKYKDYMYM